MTTPSVGCTTAANILCLVESLSSAKSKDQRIDDFPIVLCLRAQARTLGQSSSVRRSPDCLQEIKHDV
jgi:hypothetical protein